MQKNIAIYRSIDTWLEKQYAQLGLTGLQASAIMVLLDAHKLSQSELADALGVGKSAVSKVSRKLLELGYAERRRRRKDKRLHSWAFSHLYGKISMGDERCLNVGSWIVES